MTATIEARGLTKHFGKTKALDGLDLTADAGQVVAVLGPNGAGKTTFVRTVATLLRPDEGTLLVAGRNARTEPAAVRRLIGLAGQFAAIEPAMTGRENLEMVARLLLLDEPTTGLDPRSRIELWDAIRELVQAGTDVLLTTQYLDEADHLASQVVIIDHGTSVATGSPAELKRQIGGSIVELHVRSDEDLPKVAEMLRRLGHGDVQIDAATRQVSVRVDSGGEALMAALRSLHDSGVELEDIAMRQPNLDEVFLALTGRPAEDSVAMAASAA